MPNQMIPFRQFRLAVLSRVRIPSGLSVEALNRVTEIPKEQRTVGDSMVVTLLPELEQRILARDGEQTEGD